MCDDRRCSKPGVSPYVLGALFLFLLLSPAASGPVGNLKTFTNGAVADADEVNANFDALRDAINDNDARLKAAEAAMATEYVSGMVILQPGESAEIRPPVGESWIIESIRRPDQGQATFQLTDGDWLSHAPAGLLPVEKRMWLPISNALWLHFARLASDSSAIPYPLYYTGHKLKRYSLVVTIAQDIGYGEAHDFTPPAGHFIVHVDALQRNPEPWITTQLVQGSNGVRYKPPNLADLSDIPPYFRPDHTPTNWLRADGSTTLRMLNHDLRDVDILILSLAPR